VANDARLFAVHRLRAPPARSPRLASPPSHANDAEGAPGPVGQLSVHGGIETIERDRIFPQIDPSPPTRLSYFLFKNKTKTKSKTATDLRIQSPQLTVLQQGNIGCLSRQPLVPFDRHATRTLSSTWPSRANVQQRTDSCLLFDPFPHIPMCFRALFEAILPSFAYIPIARGRHGCAAILFARPVHGTRVFSIRSSPHHASIDRPIKNNNCIHFSMYMPP
jgi:hypothetical protein